MKRKLEPELADGSDSDTEDNNGENKSTLDPVFGQHRALPIDQSILKAVKPGQVPTDAQTYLALVRREAEESSSVMFKETIIYEESTDVAVSGSSSNSVVTTDDTTNDRSGQLTEILAQFHKDRSTFPEIGSLEIPDGFRTPSNFTEWFKYFSHNAPSSAVISNFDQDLTVRLLVYCTKWLTKKTNSNISQWIYQLLVRLPALLQDSNVAVLRALGQRAKRLIDNGECNETSERCCLEILAVVGKEYGQSDLISFKCV